MTSSRQLRLTSGERLSLDATFGLPDAPQALIVLARGGPSDTLRRGNDAVRRALERTGFATLTVDLLTPEETRAERDDGSCLELEVLGQRLAFATHAIARDPDARHLAAGYFGAGLFASVALAVAGRDPRSVRAVVACDPSPALAVQDLPRVVAPTLLVVAERDAAGMGAAVEELHLLRAEKKLGIVPGVTRAFETPRAMERVALLAAAWFARHLSAPERAWIEEPRGRLL